MHLPTPDLVNDKPELSVKGRWNGGKEDPVNRPLLVGTPPAPLLVLCDYLRAGCYFVLYWVATDALALLIRSQVAVPIQTYPGPGLPAVLSRLTFRETESNNRTRFYDANHYHFLEL